MRLLLHGDAQTVAELHDMGRCCTVHRQGRQVRDGAGSSGKAEAITFIAVWHALVTPFACMAAMSTSGRCCASDLAGSGLEGPTEQNQLHWLLVHLNGACTARIRVPASPAALGGG